MQKAKATGSFTTQDSGTVDITFEECEEPATKVKCQSGATSGLVLTEGAVQLVDVEAALHLGVLITPHEHGSSANMLKLQCSLITALDLGAVIGLVDGKTGSPLLSLEKCKELLALWHESGVLGEQAITTCALLKPRVTGGSST
jgi:hypothetical protein